jgi:regulator of replication initiation timing
MDRTRAELARLAEVISGLDGQLAVNSDELMEQITELNNVNAHLRLELSNLRKEKAVLDAAQKKAEVLIGSALDQIDEALAANSDETSSDAVEIGSDVRS